MQHSTHHVRQNGALWSAKALRRGVGLVRLLQTDGQYWAWRQANDTFGDAADDEVREPGAAVRTHDDEIGLNRRRVLDNRVRDMTHAHRRDQRETSGRQR